MVPVRTPPDSGTAPNRRNPGAARGRLLHPHPADLREPRPPLGPSSCRQDTEGKLHRAATVHLPGAATAHGVGPGGPCDDSGDHLRPAPHVGRMRATRRPSRPVPHAAHTMRPRVAPGGHSLLTERCPVPARIHTNAVRSRTDPRARAADPSRPDGAVCDMVPLRCDEAFTDDAEGRGQSRRRAYRRYCAP